MAEEDVKMAEEPAPVTEKKPEEDVKMAEEPAPATEEQTEATAAEEQAEKAADTKATDGQQEEAADGAAATQEEAEKEEEKKKEEEDAPEDARAKIATAVGFSAEESTLNALPSGKSGRLLMSLSDGGFQQLIAGARCNVGIKAGRYMFEIIPVEEQRRSEEQSSRSVLRIGFTLAGASLLMPDVQASTGVSFDSEGVFADGKTRRRIGKKFSRDQVAALVLNLDSSSGAYANTISLFVDGVRASEPQPIPEALLGKPLYPTVSYRGVTARVNFGPEPLRPLPFRCTMLQGAAAEDCVVTEASQPNGKQEVVVPVALPGEGMVDWCDSFMSKSRHFVELSRRAMQEWTSRSRVGSSTSAPLQRPAAASGDEKAIQRAVSRVAPVLDRSLLLADAKSNLLAEERKALLQRFPAFEFKRTAVVLVGEPPEDHKAFVQEAMLEEKRQKAAEDLRRKQAAQRRNGGELKRKAGEAEAAEEEVKEPEVEEEKAPEVELTEEERKRWHRKSAFSELSQAELARCFADFTFPSEDEGFDSVRFEWQDAEKAKEIMREWMLQRKRTLRVEGLQPSKWFEGKTSEWQKLYQDWKKKQGEWKSVLDTLNSWKSEGKDDDEKKDEQPTEMDAEDLDVFAVENVNDIGSGEPLFAKFEFEDWTLLSLRLELHFLVYAFQRDVDDPDRPSFSESHLGFYYNRYYKKSLNLKMFGVEDARGLLEMVKDTAVAGPAESGGMLEAKMPLDTPFEKFLRITEEDRRDRQRRSDAGDETAAIKFQRAPPPAVSSSTRSSQGAASRGSNGTSSRGPSDGRSGATQSSTSSRPQYGGSRHASSSAPIGTSSYASSRSRPAAPPPASSASRSRYDPPHSSREPPAKQARYSSSSAGASSQQSRYGGGSDRGGGYDYRSGSSGGQDRGGSHSYDRGQDRYGSSRPGSGGGGGYDRGATYDSRGSYDSRGPPRGASTSSYDRGSYDRGAYRR